MAAASNKPFGNPSLMESIHDDFIEYNRDIHEDYKQDQRDHKKAMAKKKKRLVKGSKWNPIKARMDTLKPKQVLGLKNALRKEILRDISKKASIYGRNFKGSTLGWAQKKFGTGGALIVDTFKRKTLAKKNQRWLNATRVKQVLPTVGRTIGVASGWGTLIAGVSLLAQTKKAKKFRQDPIHRRAIIKNYLMKGETNE